MSDASSAVVPSPADILSELTSLANRYWIVAVLWHWLIAAGLTSVLFGLRPSSRTIGLFLAGLPASVALLAARADSFFNALTFSALTIALITIAVQLPRSPVAPAHPWSAPLGAGLLALGWVYPHFLETETAAAFLVAAPVGVVPCATLLVLLGLTSMAGGLSRAWSTALGIASLFYGAFGALVLGVRLDAVLLLGALLAFAMAHSFRRPVRLWRRVGSRA